MINEEKVVLMTKASLCEAKETKKKLKIAGYFRHDYISLQLLSGWFFCYGQLWALRGVMGVLQHGIFAG